MTKKMGRPYDERHEYKEKDNERRRKKKDFNGKADKKKQREFKRRKQEDHENSYDIYEEIEYFND